MNSLERDERRDEEKVKIEVRIIALFTALDRKKCREHQNHREGGGHQDSSWEKNETLEMGCSDCQDHLNLNLN